MSEPITRLNAALEGRYRIESELGEGGMATVYLAEDIKHERKVALKVLKPELAAVVGAERFLAEIKTTANLQHPHILPLFDSGEADGLLFYVMPYVEGESLRDKLDREHQLPVDEAVRLTIDVAAALDYAHREGVIHRDIKPANVLILDGQPVIADFGIALAVGAVGAGRLTGTGVSVGTPHYMSPEQATGDLAVGPGSDTYSLGCVLYEMLVGEPPYTARSFQAILGKILAGEADSVSSHRKSVPKNVDDAIARSLEKVAADRFTTAHDFAEALGDPSFRYGDSSPGAELPRPRPRRRPTRRPEARWLGAGIAVGVAVGIGIALGTGALLSRDEPPGPPYCTWHDPAAGDPPGARQISCDLEDVALSDLLREFADSLGRSFISARAASLQITSAVVREDWNVALEVLLRGYGLVAEVDEDGNTTVFENEELNDRERVEQLTTTVHRFSNMEASDVDHAVGGLMSERGKFTVDEASQTLIVTDIRRVQLVVVAVLAELDQAPQPDSVR